MKTLFTIALSALLSTSLLYAETGEIPKDYPLKSCPVSKELLGSGGMVPFKITHGGTDVWLCCKMCTGLFNKNADQYTKLVLDANKAAAK